MSDAIRVLAPGTKITVASDIEATVRLSRIGPQRCVTYLVAWWHDGQIREEWIPEAELPQFPESSNNGRYLEVTLR